MIFLHGQSPDTLYLRALQLACSGTFPVEDSRLGRVVELGPGVFELLSDRDRFVFLRGRCLNPFFAMVEACWVLAGENSLTPLEFVLPDYGRFSDDGSTLCGAYGYRFRVEFGIDQFEAAIRHLSAYPKSRRVVLTIYSPRDILADSQDIPCNTQVLLKRRSDSLDVTVISRSNDLFLGVPYDWFVFHAIQSYLAAKLRCRVGIQRHFSDCLHLYVRDLPKAEKVCELNSIAGIAVFEARVPPFDVSTLISSYKEIASLRFDQIADSDLRSFFYVFLATKQRVSISESLTSIQAMILRYLIHAWKGGSQTYWRGVMPDLASLDEVLNYESSNRH